MCRKKLWNQKLMQEINLPLKKTNGHKKKTRKRKEKIHKPKLDKINYDIH